MFHYISVDKIKYELHQEYLKQESIQKLKEMFVLEEWWKNYGAFTVIVPRRMGKTTLMKALIQEKLNKNEQVTAIVPAYNFNSFKKDFQNPVGLMVYNAETLNNFDFRGINCKNISLFIDEFTYLQDNEIYKHFFSLNWQEINMFGTLI